MITRSCNTSTSRRRGCLAITGLLLLATAAACGESETSGSSARGTPNRPPVEPGGGVVPGSDDPIFPDSASAPNLGQGGAQDIGELRQVLESGGIPGPGVLDEVGFFNVHRIDFPAPDCGEDICLHALLGSMGNMISGSTCTLMLIGMNTPIQPADLPRPPADLVVALDTSAGAAPYLDLLRDALTQLLGELGPDDTITLIAFDARARLVADQATRDSAALRELIQILRAEGHSDLYAGLRLAFEQAEALAEPGRQARVLLVSTTPPSTGITSATHLREMAAGFGDRGIGLTVVATGTAPGALLRDLAGATGGSFLFYDDLTELASGFAAELATFLVPIARDVRITVVSGNDYWLARIHGASDTTLLTDRSGFVEIPSLFLAQRTSAEPPPEDGSRRGGGGGIVAEVIPIGLDQPTSVGQVTLEYRVPGTNELRVQTVAVTAAVPPGEEPPEGSFDSYWVEKAFVMVNLYIGFELAAARAANADLLGALDILGALDYNVGVWLEDNPDIDIQDDYLLLQRFIENVEAEWDLWVQENPGLEGSLGVPATEGEPTAPPPRPRPEPWPQD